MCSIYKDEGDHVAYNACRTLGLEPVEVLLACIIAAASELPSCSITAGGMAGLQAAHEAARTAASSASDAQPEENMPPGEPKARLAHAGKSQ